MGALGVTLIAIGALVVGLILGAIGGVYFLKNKMMNMKMSDTDLAAMAKNMGMNLNQKQLQQIQKGMKNFNPNMGKKRR